MQNHEVSPNGQTEGEMPRSPISSYNAIDNLNVLIAVIEASSNLRPGDTRGGEILESGSGLLGVRMSRRGLMGLGLGAGLALTTAGLNGDFLRSAEAVSKDNFALPVDSNERDVRLVNMQESSVEISSALGDNSRPVILDSFEFNSIFSDVEGQGRLDLASRNNHIRNHHLSQVYLKGGRNPADLISLLESGGMPPEPDMGDYLSKIRSNEDLSYEMMALPSKAEAVPANVDWRRVRPELGTKYRFSPTYGIYEVTGATGQDGKDVQQEGVSIRVSPEGLLEYEMFTDLNLLRSAIDKNPTVDPQLMVNVCVASAMRVASVIGQMTLGIKLSNNENLFNKYFTSSYSAQKLIMEMFPDQRSLFFGEKKDLSEILPHVNFSLPQAA